MALPRVVANFSKLDNITYATGTENASQTSLENDSMNIASALYIYFTPVLVVFGSIGNLVSIFIFLKSKLKFQSTSQYLCSLALSDTIFLIQLVPPWLNAVRVTRIFTRNGFCQVFVYVSYVTCCLSAWLVVAFTIERFVAVLYPLRRSVICTVTRARYIILTLVATALLVNVPVLRFAVPTDNDCNIDYDFLTFAARFNMVDTAISFTVPLAVIIVLNCGIMLGVYKLERTRHHLVKPPVRPTEEAGRTPSGPGSQHRVTRMLLLVSTVFVLFNMPAYTMRILAYAYDSDKKVHIGRWSVLQQLALMCFHSNFGINFVLYCLSGQNFRKALRQTMPRLGRAGRRATVARRGTSARPGRASSVSMSLSAASMVSYTDAVNNGGGAATEAPAASKAAASGPRRLNRDIFIRRWKFDNSRQQQKSGQRPVRSSSEPIEMKVFAGGNM